jgi:hypothetical protein
MTEESMKNAGNFAVVLGMGLFLALSGFAQAPAEQTAPASVPAPVAAIPADQQPTQEQLTKLFELMRVRENLASVSKMMPELMQQQIAAQAKEMQKDHPGRPHLTEEQQQAIAKITSKFMERVINLYSADEMIADMAALYQKHLSSSDVDDLIGFYSSPAGQHLLAMQPVIMKEFMPTVMQRIQERSKPLIDEMSKEIEAITKPQTPPANKPIQK